jgi:iron complex outermembrane receptor protein
MKKIFTKASKYLLAGLLLPSIVTPLNAQVADTLSLPEISISANRFDVPDIKLSTMIQRYDVNEIPEAGFISAGDILKRNSRYVIRTYGPGQAQTAGSIGFNSSQVKVIWNGIELNHPMLGLVDLSLFPAVLLDEISVDNQLGSSEYGSSAIGGTVLMESGYGSSPKTSAEFSIGSFNSQQYSITTNGSINKWSYSLGLVNLSQDNDYTFETTSGAEISRENADKEQFTGLGSARYTGDAYWGDVSVWFSTGETGAPGSISFPSAAARQKDRSLRVVHRSNWEHSGQFQSQLIGSFNRMGLDYTEPAFAIESVSDVDVYSLNYGVRFTPNDRYQIRMRTGFDVSDINSTDFTIDNASRFYIQTNGLLSLTDSFILYPSARFDSYSEFDNAVSYGLGLNYELIPDKLFALANINRNYAPPTFNDLYWPGFGNPDLEPETALKSDIGFSYQMTGGNVGLSYFNSKIDNGILWWADASGNFSPNNVNELRSNGLTAEFESSFKLGGVTTSLLGSFTWLNAEYDMRGNDGSLQGNRVVYSPEYRAGSELMFKYRSAGLSWYYDYTSDRPINDLNSVELEAVHLVNVSAFYTIETAIVNVRLTGSIQNLSDESYQLIYDYPKPGRTWNLGLRLYL